MLAVQASRNRSRVIACPPLSLSVARRPSIAHTAPWPSVQRRGCSRQPFPGCLCRDESFADVNRLPLPRLAVAQRQRLPVQSHLDDQVVGHAPAVNHRTCRVESRQVELRAEGEATPRRRDSADSSWKSTVPPRASPAGGRNTRRSPHRWPGREVRFRARVGDPPMRIRLAEIHAHARAEQRE